MESMSSPFSSVSLDTSKCLASINCSRVTTLLTDEHCSWRRDSVGRERKQLPQRVSDTSVTPRHLSLHFLGVL